MLVNVCSLCEHPNPPGAQFCNACGVGLVVSCAACGAVCVTRSKHCAGCGAVLDEPEDTQPGAFDAWRPVTGSGALWLDLDAPPAASNEPVARPEPPVLTLRVLDDVFPPAATVDALEAELIRSEPQSFVAPPPGPPELPPGPAAPAPVAPGEVDSAKKTARRALVRRARVAHSGVRTRPAAATIDVLVLDADGAARRDLCGLLEAFGFRPVATASLDEAQRYALTQRFAVAFVDLVFDANLGGSGVELCQSLKERARAAVLVTTAHERPVDRVRASLVGADGFLVKPLTRGEVARALDGCEVALPSDQRRA